MRFGAADDQSPTRDSTRNPIIPDSDSYWAAFGLEYPISPQAKLDVAYGHIFAKDASIEQSATAAENTFRGNLYGTITNSHVDYLAIQFAYRF